MKERDWSNRPKELKRKSIDELANPITHEVPANRKARRDAMRDHGCFRKPRLRIKRGEADA